MRHAHKLALVVVVLFCTVGYAQEANNPPQNERKVAAKDTSEARPVYRIDFAISEVEAGKRLNTRNYALMAEDRAWAVTDMTTRVPVPVGGRGQGAVGEGISYQYMDVGLKFRLNPKENGDHIVLDGSVSMSSFAPADPAKDQINMPVVRRFSTDFQAALQPGKPTIIATLDDVNSTKQYQLEATVTKIK